jgi:hypothetical protein
MQRVFDRPFVLLLSCCLVLCGAAVAVVFVFHSFRAFPPPIVVGSDDIMRMKAFGTCVAAPTVPLRWGADADTAADICCHNQWRAEYAGYWAERPSLVAEVTRGTRFFDSTTGAELFVIRRSRDEFLADSKSHGWPAFVAEEVNWSNVRVLRSGEVVSLNGTHLGDLIGSRFCINLVCIAGSV